MYLFSQQSVFYHQSLNNRVTGTQVIFSIYCIPITGSRVDWLSGYRTAFNSFQSRAANAFPFLTHAYFTILCSRAAYSLGTKRQTRCLCKGIWREMDMLYTTCILQCIDDIRHPNIVSSHIFL